MYGNKFPYKSNPPKHFLLLGYFEKRPLLCETDSTTFWATFGLIWATFIFQHLVTLKSRISVLQAAPPQRNVSDMLTLSRVEISFDVCVKRSLEFKSIPTLVMSTYSSAL